jgi:hypothetical protein
LAVLKFAVRVQRCGKSVPAESRGFGSVNPSWKQGERESRAQLVFLALVPVV